MKLLLLLSLTAIFSSALAGYNNIRTQKTYDGNIRSLCQYDQDCLVRNSYCEGHKICACKPKFRHNRNLDSCEPTELNLRCNDPEDCPFPQSECRDGICQCQANHVPSELAPNCLPMSRLQSQCEDDTQCRVSDQFSHCNITSKICDCNPGYHAAIDTNQCIPNKRVRDLCESTSDCINSLDERGAVECKPDTDSRRRCTCTSDEFVVRNNVCVRGIGGAGQLIASIIAILISSLVVYFC